MNKKWLGRIFIASVVVLFVNLIFLAIYYLVIKKDYEGPMEPWAIVLLVIPFAILCILIIIFEVKTIKVEDVFSKNGIVSKIGSVILKIFSAIGIVFLLPVFLIFAIVEIFIVCLTDVRKSTFKKLIKKGFVYKKKDKKYILTKENIIIEIPFGLEDYYISLDAGEQFVRIEESDLGTSYARESLKQKLEEYKYAHPVDKQRGDAIPPIHEVVEFLNSVLD